MALTVEPLPAATRADRLSSHHQQLMTMVRSRADATAKGLAAIGGTIVSAIGIAKFADVFPYEGPFWALALLVVAIGLMLAGLISLIRTLQTLAEPIVADIDPGATCDNNGLDPPEREIVERIYANMAQLNRVESLEAYNARAHRFERIANQGRGPTADELRLRADLIRAEVLSAQNRAVLLALGKRTTRTLRGRQTMVPIVLIVCGLIAASASADKIESERPVTRAAQPQPVLLPQEEHV